MMTMNKSAILALCGAALAVSGCSSMRDAAGLTKRSPDEFAVSTKAPLVIPPDFNLRPPMPGAPMPGPRTRCFCRRPERSIARCSISA